MLRRVTKKGLVCFYTDNIKLFIFRLGDWSKGQMYIETQLLYQLGVSETTCFGLIGGHHQVYSVDCERLIVIVSLLEPASCLQCWL